MIADSDKHTFESVLVYQLDRFARNHYDSAINKAKLKKNGVRVISARENISDDASGILVEGVLESMAEYYSAEFSQKIHRGMELNAQKCLSNGSNPGLGYIEDGLNGELTDCNTCSLLVADAPPFCDTETTIHFCFKSPVLCQYHSLYQNCPRSFQKYFLS